MSDVRVYHGDSRELVRAIPDNSVDGVACDPPYALVSIVERYGSAEAKPTAADVYARGTAGFMNRAWDTGETAFSVEFWAEVLRVLKPGGYVFACSGSRTYHRLACAIEDAGFEIRDMVADLVSQDDQVQAFAASLSPGQASAFARLLHESPFGGVLAWIYGCGFPSKSKDLARMVDDYLGHPTPKGQRHVPVSPEAKALMGYHTALKPALEPIVLARKPLVGGIARNALAFGLGGLNIDACRIGLEAADTEDLARPLTRNVRAEANIRLRAQGVAQEDVARLNEQGRWPANVVHDGSAEVLDAFPDAVGQRGSVNGDEPSAATGEVWNARSRIASAPPRGDAGSAARFFYSAKADEEDRLGTDHPTVKRVDLMEWGIRLICPPGGVVLDPFAGSGTTGLAAMAAGCDAILIEREADHAEDIRRRLAWARGEGRLTRQEILSRELAKDPGAAMGLDTPLFAGGGGQ